MKMLFLLALLAVGQGATEKVAAGAPATLQQQFDAASDAAATLGKCGEAIAMFEAIERSGAAKRSALVAAAIDVRKGRCLVLTGREAEGEAAIHRGLPQLEARGAAFAVDARNAKITLGEAAYNRFDYDSAIRQYEAVLAQSQGLQRLMPLMLLSRALMFDHDGRALRYAEEARTIVKTAPAASKRDIANVQTQYARVLLNEGRDGEAYAELRDSLAKQGGLDSRVNLDDIATRSDLAIAALRNKDVAAAQRYLVYTGAGRMKDAPFSKAVSMDPPACDPTIGLTADDVAIVEFILEEDGHVAGVMPIFSTGRRATALAFAQAVKDWSWRPDDAKAIPLIFRYGSRVELRCVRAPEAPSVMKPLIESADAWFAAQGLSEAAWADMSDARALPLQRAGSTDGGAAGLRATMALALNPIVDAKELEALRQQAMTRAAALRAPVAMRVAMVVSDTQDWNANKYRAALRALLTEPDVAADPIASATLRLMIAAPRYKSRSPEDASALLDAVISAPLAETHPLKVAALLQRANLLAAANDLAGARAAFARTGLTAEQCSLVGLSPAATRPGGSSSDYPMAAVRMGFEGWVRAEFDITADGRTATQRAVVAYPPFIFNDAAIGIVRGSRWTSSFRPEGALACAGQQRSVVFNMP